MRLLKPIVITEDTGSEDGEEDREAAMFDDTAAENAETEDVEILQAYAEEALAEDAEYESALDEDNAILTVDEFANEFNEKNKEVFNVFNALEYTNVIQMGAATEINQDLSALDFNEDDEYDFSRPEQEESQLVREIGDNLSRPSSKYIRELDIELGNLIKLHSLL